MTVNWKFGGFGLLVGQKKLFENLALDFIIILFIIHLIDPTINQVINEWKRKLSAD